MQPVPQNGHQRFDFAHIGSVEVLSTGALRIPAVLGRVGVLSYERGGKTVRELRPPDEVFRADSMQTFSGAIATDLHPPRDKAWITPTNWKDWAVGYVSGGASRSRLDSSLLEGHIIVQDADMVGKVLSGERSELSPGYMALALDETPGRYDSATGEYGPHVKGGEPYDVIQRDIVNNSVGIGPRGWGRQGSKVALRLDGADAEGDAHVGVLHLDGTALGDFVSSRMKQLNKSLAELAEETGIISPKEPEDKPLLRSGPRPRRTYVLESILDGWTERPSDAQLSALSKALDVTLDDLTKLIPEDLKRLDGVPNPNPQQARNTMETIDIRLDGLTVSVPKQAAEVINKAIADRDSELKALKDAASENKARLDGATEQLATATKQLQELPGQLKAELASRGKLEAQAQSVLATDGTAIKLDGKSDREVRELVLAKLAEDDTYVRVRFDMAMDSYRAPDASAKAHDAILGGPTPAVRMDAADEPNPAAARAEMLKRQQDAWKPTPAN